MDFLYPLLINLFWVVPIIVILFVFSWKEKKKRMVSFGDIKLMDLLSGSVSRKKQMYKMAIIIVVILFLVISAAGPAIGTKMQEIKRKGVDIFIAVDCSKSMLAEDIAPNRLSKAKSELSLFINKLQGDRVGIIAFAGTAFTQCPLTLDYNAAKMFLDTIDVNLIPRPGTNLPAAISTAVKGFVRKENKFKALILLTDGENHEGSIENAIEEAKKEGIRIYAIGLGTPTGDPVPERDENGNVSGYLKDKSGGSVMSVLDETSLQKLAIETGGAYYRASDGEMEVDRIYDDISNMDKKELQARVYSQRENRYQYFLFIALILLLLETMFSEKKGIFIGSLIFILFLLPFSGNAGIKGKINKGNSFYNKGEYQEALDQYKDAQIDEPRSDILFFNSGDALYKAEDYDRSLEEFSKANFSKNRTLQQKAYYNAGNCLYMKDKLQEAIQFYKKSLDLDPGDKDAKYNLELLTMKLKQGMKSQKNKKQEDKQKDKQEQKDKQQQKDKDKKEGENKDQEQQDQDQKKQDQQPGEKKDEMSKQDAQRILDAFQESEMKALKESKKKVPVSSGNAGKEW